MQSLSCRVGGAAFAGVFCFGIGFATSERIAERRARRLERLRDFAAVAAKRVTAAEFQKMPFDGPVVITGLIDNWPARHSWTFSALRKRIGHANVDIGSIGNDGVPFYAVCHNAMRPALGSHDLGMAVFDADFSEGSGKASLLEDWQPLQLFTSDDVFSAGQAASHPDRPDYRWLLVAPPGSGSPMHQDPWMYSSWNASLVGRKRWVFFPPGVPHAVLHPRHEGIRGSISSFVGLPGYRNSAEFMDEVLPVLREANLGHVELLQAPGDVVAFPAGWWHAVVNIDATIAITESFGEPRNLDAIVESLRAGKLHAFADLLLSEARGTSRNHETV